jgi:hypothetical protein
MRAAHKGNIFPAEKKSVLTYIEAQKKQLSKEAVVFFDSIFVSKVQIRMHS